MNEILFLISAFFSEIIGTIAGFGSSTIFLPLALFFVDFKTALVLVALFHIFGNIGRLTFFKHGLSKRLLLIFGLPSIIFTILGASLVGYISQELLKLILGIFLIIFSLAMLIRPDIKFKKSKRNAIAGGSLSGFFAGLIGTGGAMRGAFLTSFNLNKNIYIATAAAIALAVDITRVPIYFGSGFLKQEFYYLVPLLLITAILGSYIGSRIVKKIPQNKFRKFVLIAIALVSMKFICEGINYLA